MLFDQITGGPSEGIKLFGEGACWRCGWRTGGEGRGGGASGQGQNKPGPWLSVRPVRDGGPLGTGDSGRGELVVGRNGVSRSAFSLGEIYSFITAAAATTPPSFPPPWPHFWLVILVN